MTGRGFARKLFTSACAVTHTTELAAKGLGTAYFLPALFVDRFARLGGIDRELFAAQLAECRSFRDDDWVNHWNGIAADHIRVADAALAELGGPSVKELLDPDGSVDTTALGELLAPAASILSQRGAFASPDALAEFRQESNGIGDQAAIAVDALIKIITCTFAAAWPGRTPRRLAAHAESRRLCDALTEALAPAMGVSVERIDIPVPGGDIVHGTALFPLHAEKSPMVLLSNGIEGTVAELLLPVLAYRPAGMAMFFMEMPGTYTYQQPLAEAAENVYAAVIDRLAADHRVDPTRLGMFGISFGAYWSTRMAATDARLRAVVSNGAPTHRTFQPSGAFGIPEIMVSTLTHATRARHTIDLTAKLRALSLKGHYARITTPLLVINGDTDTLVSTQDSIDLATHAPNALLKLYPDDDHCAMGHAPHWFELCMRFLAEHLSVDVLPPSPQE